MNNAVIIGFDTEYERIPDTDRNHVLSYQYAGRYQGETWSGIIYTEGPAIRQRITLEDLVLAAVDKGRKLKLLPRKWPDTVFLAAHFSRADISHFRNFPKIKRRFDGIASTYATLLYPYKATLFDKSRNKRKLNIYLVDTMLLTPNRGGLEVLGEMHNFSKLKMSQEELERMSHVLAEEPERFKEYAIRDAEIAALHVERMMEFARDNMGLPNNLTTLGSLAVRDIEGIWKALEIDTLEVLGSEKTKEKEWDANKHRFKTKLSKVPISIVHHNATLATECYHGGRNEAYVFGFSELGLWYDFDLAGAYTTAMAAIKMPDYEHLRHTTNLADFKLDELGFASIKFEFPDNTRFPCLPIRTDNGLIFPLKGVANVCSPEIVLALNMGCQIEIVEGFVVPWASDIKPFEAFSMHIHEKRAANDKGSMLERMWKEIGNSLYGKLAQGLQKKRVFDTRAADMKALDPSKITQPYLAAYTTSLVRAVLGECIAALPHDKMVISATTDGFITSASEDELVLDGPLCMFFKDLRMALTGVPTIIEMKHFVFTVLCWKTRGQASVTIADTGKSPLLAKAGIKAPRPEILRDTKSVEVLDHIESESDRDEHIKLLHYAEEENTQWILKQFVEREHDTKFGRSDFISMSDMFVDEADLIALERDISLNMEYDWKREMFDVHEREVPISKHGEYVGSHKYPDHIFASTRPWNDIVEFQTAREMFDEWRTKEQGVLKSLEDWERWHRYRAEMKLSKKGVQRSKGGIVDQAKRIILKAFTTSCWGLPGTGYPQMADHLTKHGFATTLDQVKYAKRAKTKLVEHSFAADEAVLKLVAVVLGKYPDFQWQKLFETAAYDQVQEYLEAHTLPPQDGA